jgi:HSP20 family protein
MIPFGFGGSLSRENDPFASLHREMNRLFSDFSRGGPSLAPFGEAMPKIDVAETEKDIQITAELPGLEAKEVELSVSGDVLTIRGEKKAEKEEKNKNFHLVERSYGSFARAVPLPAEVNADRIEAMMDKGILKITLPKAPEAQTKKIEIKAV